MSVQFVLMSLVQQGRLSWGSGVVGAGVRERDIYFQVQYTIYSFGFFNILDLM